MKAEKGKPGSKPSNKPQASAASPAPKPTPAPTPAPTPEPSPAPKPAPAPVVYPVVPTNDWIDDVIKNDPHYDGSILLFGYLGKSADDSSVDLYSDAGLNNKVTIKKDNIIHVLKTGGSNGSLEGSHVWVKKDGDYEYSHDGANNAHAKFLQGDIYTAYLKNTGAATVVIPTTTAAVACPTICGNLTDDKGNPRQNPVYLPTAICPAADGGNANNTMATVCTQVTCPPTHLIGCQTAVLHCGGGQTGARPDTNMPGCTGVTATPDANAEIRTSPSICICATTYTQINCDPANGTGNTAATTCTQPAACPPHISLPGCVHTGATICICETTHTQVTCDTANAAGPGNTAATQCTHHACPPHISLPGCVQHTHLLGCDTATTPPTHLLGCNTATTQPTHLLGCNTATTPPTHLLGCNTATTQPTHLLGCNTATATPQANANAAGTQAVAPTWAWIMCNFTHTPQCRPITAHHTICTIATGGNPHCHLTITTTVQPSIGLCPSLAGCPTDTLATTVQMHANAAPGNTAATVCTQVGCPPHISLPGCVQHTHLLGCNTATTQPTHLLGCNTATTPPTHLLGCNTATTTPTQLLGCNTATTPPTHLLGCNTATTPPVANTNADTLIGQTAWLTCQPPIGPTGWLGCGVTNTIAGQTHVCPPHISLPGCVQQTYLLGCNTATAQPTHLLGCNTATIQPTQLLGCNTATTPPAANANADTLIGQTAWLTCQPPIGPTGWQGCVTNTIAGHTHVCPPHISLPGCVQQTYLLGCNTATTQPTHLLGCDTATATPTNMPGCGGATTPPAANANAATIYAYCPTLGFTCTYIACPTIETCPQQNANAAAPQTIGVTGWYTCAPQCTLVGPTGWQGCGQANANADSPVVSAICVTQIGCNITVPPMCPDAQANGGQPLTSAPGFPTMNIFCIPTQPTACPPIISYPGCVQPTQLPGCNATTVQPTHLLGCTTVTHTPTNMPGCGGATAAPAANAAAPMPTATVGFTHVQFGCPTHQLWCNHTFPNCPTMPAICGILPPSIGCPADDARIKFPTTNCATVHCPIPTTNCPIPTANCPVQTANCPIPTTNCPIPTANCPVQTTNCPIPTATCPVPTGANMCGIVAPTTQCRAGEQPNVSVATHCPTVPPMCPVTQWNCRTQSPDCPAPEANANAATLPVTQCLQVTQSAAQCAPMTFNCLPTVAVACLPTGHCRITGIPFIC